MVTVLVGDWLKLAASKDEVVFLSRQRHFPSNLRMQIFDEFDQARDAVKYFREVVDRKL